MAQLPLPARGQPLDVSYLYSITEAINGITQTLSNSAINYSSVDNITTGTTDNVNTGNLKFCAGYVNLVSNQQSSTVAANQPYTFTWNYPGSVNFKYPPIVTATVQNGATASTTGSKVTVVLTNVNTDSCSGQVFFLEPGEATVSINLIAIGLSAQVAS